MVLTFDPESPERLEGSLCAELAAAVGSCHEGFPLLSCVRGGGRHCL